MVPIFLLFLATHIVIVVGAFVLHGREIPAIAAGVVDGVRSDAQSLGTLGILALARGLGVVADARAATGIEAVDAADLLCRQTAEELPKSVFFAGKLIFQRERFWQRILHNETAYQIQTRLQWSGLPTVVLPVRVYG